MTVTCHVQFRILLSLLCLSGRRPNVYSSFGSSCRSKAFPCLGKIPTLLYNVMPSKAYKMVVGVVQSPCLDRGIEKRNGFINGYKIPNHTRSLKVSALQFTISG